MVKKVKKKGYGIAVPAKPIADGILFLPDVMRGLTSFYTSINLRKPDGKESYSQDEFENLTDIRTSLLRCAVCRKQYPVGEGKLYFFRKWRMIPKEVLNLALTVEYICGACVKVGKRISTKVQSPQLNDLAFVISFTPQEKVPETAPATPEVPEAPKEEKAAEAEEEFREDLLKEEEPGHPSSIDLAIAEKAKAEAEVAVQDNQEKQEPIEKTEETKEEKNDGSIGQQVPGSPEGLEQEKRDTPGGTQQEG